MDKPFESLDHHFQLPDVAGVEAARPLRWLRAGWSDLCANPVASLGYGVIFAALGYLVLSYAIDLPYLFTAAISGFFLVGPLAAAGAYEISRQREAGNRVTFAESFSGLRPHADALLYFGVFLAFTLILWERLSALLFALFYQDNIPDLANFYRHVLFSGEYVHFLVAYFVIGGALAALVFSLSAVAVPMLMDRDSDMVTAMMTSMRAVGANLGAMALWAAIIVALIGVGFATAMIGLVILLPLLGHATWHAYRDLVR